MRATVTAILVGGLALAGCGGGGGADAPVNPASTTAAAPATATAATTQAPPVAAPAAPATTPAAPAAALDETSLCEDWAAADGAAQRDLAATLGGEAMPTDDVLALLAGACTDAARGRLVADVYAEALVARLAEDAAASADPYAATRIGGKVAREIATSVRTSWNACGEKDVCIPGEPALSVGCAQPDLDVAKLRCFVVTEKAADGSYGYTVAVDVAGDGSYSWRLARDD